LHRRHSYTPRAKATFLLSGPAFSAPTEYKELSQLPHCQHQSARSNFCSQSLVWVGSVLPKRGVWCPLFDIPYFTGCDAYKPTNHQPHSKVSWSLMVVVVIMMVMVMLCLRRSGGRSLQCDKSTHQGPFLMLNCPFFSQVMCVRICRPPPHL
jgi:hypothetical protein